VKIVVTGATGFVGRHLLRSLVSSARWQVVGAVRNEAGAAAVEGVEYVRVGDLTHGTDWSGILPGAHAVVALAATVHQMSRAPNAAPVNYDTVNVESTLGLARAAAVHGVKRLIFLSSLKVNGEAGRFSELDPPAPLDPYGRSKLKAEEGLREIAKATGLEVTIVRPPLIYGAGVGANFGALVRVVRAGVPLPVRSIQNARSFVSVDNLCDFLTVCLAHPLAANETFLVSDGADLSTDALIRAIATALGKSNRTFAAPIWALNGFARLLNREAAMSRLTGSLLADISKAKVLLDWRPTVTVEAAMRRAFSSER
jgi:nucleoside-diphosphate-sugar epimerase